MKVYLYLNPEGFSNCYLVVNEQTNEAIIIDPGIVPEDLITKIEASNISLKAVLITHNHSSHVNGLKTLRNIYDFVTYAADWDIAQNESTILTCDGKLRIAGLLIHYTSLPGHTTDSIIFKIENMLFTGDVLCAGTIGSTNSSYSKFILKSNIENKIYSQQDAMVLMPGHGPPSTIAAVREFNIDFKPEDDN